MSCHVMSLLKKKKKITPHYDCILFYGPMYCVLIALSRCNRVFTRRLRLCHSHTVRRREVRKGDREGLNRVVSEQ